MTTYMVPQESFPVEVRASLNGIAAAAGKLGGIRAFLPTDQRACCMFVVLYLHL